MFNLVVGVICIGLFVGRSCDDLTKEEYKLNILCLIFGILNIVLFLI